MSTQTTDRPRGTDPQNPLAPGAQDTAAAICPPLSMGDSPLRAVSLADQKLDITHGGPVGEGATSTKASLRDHIRDDALIVATTAARANHAPDRATPYTATIPPSPGRVQPPAAETIGNPSPNPLAPRLLDPSLAMASDVVDDLEQVRIANENRYRQLTRAVEDSDGELRGFGLDDTHPDVKVLASIIDSLGKVEHQAILNLQRAMRRHPLGLWVKTTQGVGEKQAARLLSTVGDPYWNTLHDRPRTVSELWAYCGLHTLPVGHRDLDHQDLHATGANSPVSQYSRVTHVPPAGGVLFDGSDPRQDEVGTHDERAWVAARRAKGQKSNWSTDAKMRAWNIATSCIKQSTSPYRAVYDERRTHTADRVHAAPCVRCGPKGKPAATGTPWSLGHRHADALRIVSKAILKDLWRAARQIHTGETS